MYTLSWPCKMSKEEAMGLSTDMYAEMKSISLFPSTGSSRASQISESLPLTSFRPDNASNNEFHRVAQGRIMVFPQIASIISADFGEVDFPHKALHFPSVACICRLSEI